MTERDLSIAQRLGVAFAVLIAFITLLVVVVGHSHHVSQRAQVTYVTRILPLTEATEDVERQLLYLAVAVRSYLLHPDLEERLRFQAVYERAQDALKGLRQLPKEADGQTLFLDLDRQATAYLVRAQDAVDRRASQALSEADELALRQARELSLAAVRRFAELQANHAAASVAQLETTREQLTQRILVADFLAAVAFLAFAVWTVRAMRRPIQRLLNAAEGLQEGNWQLALRFHRDAQGWRQKPRSELRQLAKAFGAAAWALEQRERSLQVESRVATAAASSLNARDVMIEALRYISDHVGAQAGAFYRWDPQQSLLLPTVTQALASPPAPLRLGEGVPGEAALRRERLLVADIPKDAPFHLRFGIDQTPPRSVIALPLVFQDKLLGVMVLASLAGFDGDQLRFLDGMGVELSMFLQNVLAHEKLELVLSELQQQHERIQAQNEELQAQGEELQAQNEELQAQSEELQAQQGELMARNEMLQTLSERLREQQDALAEVDKRKNEFLALLAHELRNPLAPMMSSIYILKRSWKDSAQDRRPLEIIDRQTRHLTRLVDDLLDITRISQGKIQIQRSRFDLIKMLHSCIDDCRAAAVAARVRLTVNLPDTALWIVADQTRLCQVFGNLLGNAIKFTEAGGAVELTLEQQGDDAVEIRVIDTGMGIDPELLPQLFQPFMQGDAQLSRGNTGLGLGLALVKALVELHEGSVEARSEGLRRGAEFIVRLPLLAEESAPVLGEPSSAPAPRRILIIDDNVDAAETLAQVLSLEGHVTQCAFSGEEGLAKLAAEMPDVVMCDIGMPGMDGYRFAQQVRADSRYKRCLLVALTGFSSEEDRQRILQAGFDQHLAKPVPIELLNRLLASSTHSASALS